MYVKYRMIKLLCISYWNMSLIPVANANGTTKDKDKHIYLDIIIGLIIQNNNNNNRPTGM